MGASKSPAPLCRQTCRAPTPPHFRSLECFSAIMNLALTFQSKQCCGDWVLQKHFVSSNQAWSMTQLSVPPYAMSYPPSQHHLYFLSSAPPPPLACLSFSDSSYRSYVFANMIIDLFILHRMGFIFRTAHYWAAVDGNVVNYWKLDSHSDHLKATFCSHFSL